MFPKGVQSISSSTFVQNLSIYGNYFDLKQVQAVTSLEQPIGWLFSYVKVNFVFKQYLYKMGSFKVTQVEVSPAAELYSFQNDDSSDFDTQPEKLTRADYAVRESPEKQKEFKY